MSILIHKDTTVIIQGITGREAVNLTREGLDYGTRIVGGVTPGRAGRDVYGVPVHDCVRHITAKQRVDASIVTVPPRFTRDAVFEAIEAGVKLVVVVTERIPRGEVAQMVEFAALKGARIIGPNCLGVLSPDEAKVGGLGGPAVNVRRAGSPPASRSAATRSSARRTPSSCRSSRPTRRRRPSPSTRSPAAAWKPSSPTGCASTARASPSSRS